MGDCWRAKTLTGDEDGLSRSLNLKIAVRRHTQAVERYRLPHSERSRLDGGRVLIRGGLGRLRGHASGIRASRNLRWACA